MIAYALILIFLLFTAQSVVMLGDRRELRLAREDARAVAKERETFKAMVESREREIDRQKLLVRTVEKRLQQSRDHADAKIAEVTEWIERYKKTDDLLHDLMARIGLDDRSYDIDERLARLVYLAKRDLVEDRFRDDVDETLFLCARPY